MSSLEFDPNPHGRQSWAGVGLGGGDRSRVIQVGRRPPISPLLRQLVYERDKWQCQHCGNYPNARDIHRRSGVLHLDHIVPWSAGGLDRSDNLRTLCAVCNEQRSNRVDAGRDKPAMPIIRICVPCIGISYALPPEVISAERTEAFCGHCHAVSWTVKGWAIL